MSLERSRAAVRAAWSVAPNVAPALREQVETVLGYAWQALEGRFPPRRLYGYLPPLRAIPRDEDDEAGLALGAAIDAVGHALATALEREDEAGRPGLRSVPSDVLEVDDAAASRALAAAQALPRRAGHDDEPWSPPTPAPIPPYGADASCTDPWLDPHWAHRLAFDAWALAAGRGPLDPDDPFWTRIWEAHGEAKPVRGIATAAVPNGLRIALEGGPAFLPGGAPEGVGAVGWYRVAAFHAGVGFVVLAPL